MGFISIPLIVIAVVILCVLGGTFYTVHTQEAAIIERLGKFHRVAGPGLNIKIPFIDKLRTRMNLQVQQLIVEIDTKTKDNVFVTIPVAVQYQVLNGRAADAFYSLTNTTQQIEAYVQDNVRTSLATMTLDEAFESKDAIAAHVEATLTTRMGEYGWAIINTLVTDIRPEAKVRDSMNNINAEQRNREAAIQRAEAQKILAVKQAEAEAQAKELQGKGIANERKAIAEGMAEQLAMLKEAGAQAGVEINPESLLMTTLYFDTLRDAVKFGKTSVLMLPSNPSGANEFSQELRNVLLSTDVLSQPESSVVVQQQPPAPLQQ